MKAPYGTALAANDLRVLWEDGTRAFCRGWRRSSDGQPTAVLALFLTAEHPLPESLDRLSHEYRLRDQLDGAWALRPLDLAREQGRTVLVLDDPGGEPLEVLLRAPLGVEGFLRLAIGIAVALGKLHQCGLIHKDLKPAHILVNCADGRVRLTGFGLASRLPRERQASAPPQSIAGTLAYMAPEQTGWMNRSIDARSDLYALGVTLYRMLTGVLPFSASDPMEWVHCHVARKPAPPHERSHTVPIQLSAIVMKLLAKSAEERYQTATGLERDLRSCLNHWETQGCIDQFPLGQRDTPDRLLIPEILYGRKGEIDRLLGIFDRIVRREVPELVLVSGYSGIGKSSVVNELRKVLVPPRGLFAAGKFDQYERDVPYATLVQAFQGLVRSLLSGSDGELARWRDDLLEALGPNGRLMVDLVPELELLIGEQLPVPELPAHQAQGRFQLVFRRFISVFARPEHPLALFLDDLQWLDAATLDLLEDLSTRSDPLPLLLIGAYRDNEVSAQHPLMQKLDAIRTAGGRLTEITLAPLDLQHLSQLIADTLRCEPGRAAPLAELVYGKTAGNPFFVIQFLYALADGGMLTYEHDSAHWSWDIDRIHGKGYTDNVVDLMLDRLTRLPAGTLRALQILACVGNSAHIATLSIVLESSAERLQAALWEAVHQELLERRNDAYVFVHDRVREAAYSLIPEETRAADHLRIGRLLMAQTPAEQREEAIFEIVSHLNRGSALMTSQDERELLAELDLIAGQRAKGSAAYASALSYLIAGSALLAPDSWERRHELTFALEVNRAECEVLAAELADVEQRLSALSMRAVSAVEGAMVACLRSDLYHLTLGQDSRAVTVGLDYLRGVGIDWPPHPTEGDVRAEYQRIWSQLGSRTIEDLVNLPLITDTTCLAILDVLTRIAIPRSVTNVNLSALMICRAVNLSLEYGNCDASCAHYASFGRILGSRFGDYEAASRFGRLACDLVDQRGLARFKPLVYLVVGSNVTLWSKHVREGRDLVERGIDAATKAGDLIFMAHGLLHMGALMQAAGDSLVDVQRYTEASLEAARRMKSKHAANTLVIHLAYVRTLRGLTRMFGSLDDFQFEEAQIERSFAHSSDLVNQEGVYWYRKLLARFISCDYAAAVGAHSRIQRLLWSPPTEATNIEFQFYVALSHSVYYDSAPASEKQQHEEIVRAYHSQLQLWTVNCPENFQHRAALVGAEIARIENRDGEAMRLYEKAIRAANDNGFAHHEAIACELAARFYASRDVDTISQACLRKARHCYMRWGANGKVRQLDEMDPRLREEERALAPTETIGTQADQLDLTTVIRTSQAVSSEIILEKLLETLMLTVIEHAGAERGLLILLHGAEQRLVAEATTSGDEVIVRLQEGVVAETALPRSVLQYVLRTRESVILDDAASQSLFPVEAYIRQRRARSILCLPLLNQAKLVGSLYLENNLAPRVFTPARIAVLKVLASQAAISLENSRLYRDLAEREALSRRLIDANIVGIYIWEVDGRIVDANDIFLHMLGLDQRDLAAGRLRLKAITPPEWTAHAAQTVQEVMRTGSLEPYENEYVHRDGSRVPVLIGAARIEGNGSKAKGISFVVDLTKRKQAEAQVRESERQLHEVQMELAHANRVATLGQLTASIAHEVKQPIAAAATNAQAGIRWLGTQPPNLDEGRQAFARIVQDIKHADAVIGRIRDVIKKAPPRKDAFEINEAIREVIALTHGEAAKSTISVETDLADGLPVIRGDRVQLQQVVLNLVINAVEAMKDVAENERQLVISTGKTEPDNIVVMVRDSGPGLDPAAFARLFGAFYTTKPDGLGLGLSICRSIVEAHGGRLWASDNSPRGATFQFTVPVEPP